jgi:hypothetical protein
MNQIRKITIHGLYPTWRNMLARCYNESANGYWACGGRGIVVCDAWRAETCPGGSHEAFNNFVRDVGMPPSQGARLTRTDPDGNFEPTNMKWVPVYTVKLAEGPKFLPTRKKAVQRPVNAAGPTPQDAIPSPPKPPSKLGRVGKGRRANV